MELKRGKGAYAKLIHADDGTIMYELMMVHMDNTEPVHYGTYPLGRDFPNPWAAMNSDCKEYSLKLYESEVAYECAMDKLMKGVVV